MVLLSVLVRSTYSEEAGLRSCDVTFLILGSDIGGSIRMPSFFCGIFGHKPTRGTLKELHRMHARIAPRALILESGIVSNREQQPIAEKVLQTFLVTGPMSRFCADLLPMYRVLASDNVSKLKLDAEVPH